MQHSEIERIKSDFDQKIEKASTSGELEQVRIKFLSRNGIVTKLFDELKSISGEDKPVFGKLLNNLRAEVTESFNNKLIKEKEIKEGLNTYKDPSID